MSESLGRKSPRKAKPTFTYAILSVTLILLLVGVLSTGFFIVTKALAELKEKIEIEIELHADVKEDEIEALKKKLASTAYINTFEFKSKIEAIEAFEKELKQDIVGIAGFNPLYDAFIITLKSDFSDPQSLKDIETELSKVAGVRSINYSAAVMELVNANIKKVLTAGAIAIVILLLVAFSLIDNTIRLLMFSQRFIIRSMQLIGATKGFIIKPFLIRGVVAGLIAGLLSILLIGGGLWLLSAQYGWFSISEQDYLMLGAMSGGLIVSGVLICLISTYFSVNKYLGMKLDELY